MDTLAGRIDVLDPGALLAGRRRWISCRWSGEALLARPEPAERKAWLERRRRDIPATIRLLLDATTTCMEGVTPVGLEVGSARV